MGFVLVFNDLEKQFGHYTPHNTVQTFEVCKMLFHHGCIFFHQKCSKKILIIFFSILIYVKCSVIL